MEATDRNLDYAYDSASGTFLSAMPKGQSNAVYLISAMLGRKAVSQ